MYLHLGQETVVNDKNIIGIFDLEKSSLSKHTKNFLKKATNDKKVVTISYEMPKSFIICEEKGENTVYISQISSQTLLKRSDKDL